MTMNAIRWRRPPPADADNDDDDDCSLNPLCLNKLPVARKHDKEVR